MDTRLAPLKETDVDQAEAYSDSGSSPPRGRLRHALTLTPAEILAVNRRRYPDGLVCVECGRLLATRREAWAHRLTEAERLAYRCAECRADADPRRSAAIRERVERARAAVEAARLRPPLAVVRRRSRIPVSTLCECERKKVLICSWCLADLAAEIAARERPEKVDSEAPPVPEDLVGSLRAGSARQITPESGGSGRPQPNRRRIRWAAHSRLRGRLVKRPKPRQVSAASRAALARVNAERAAARKARA